jgi:hypothetical protein
VIRASVGRTLVDSDVTFFALNDYLCTHGKLHELKTLPEDCDMSIWGCATDYRRRRSSAVSEIGVFALE